MTYAPKCCVCGGEMSRRLRGWSYFCRECGTWASDLPIDINGTAHSRLDEGLRGRGLNSLRHHNNSIILSKLRAAAANGGALLDVGCAHGWFLRQATASGFSAVGVEPDSFIAAQARDEGVCVIDGTFPDALPAHLRFSVITYNDVLEHFPEPRSAVAASYQSLEPGGLLSVNIPTSEGIVFKTAVAIHRTAIGARAFERLWQVGLPSPHLWYFNEASLTHLCESEGFVRIDAARLDSVRRKGLWERAHSAESPSFTSVLGVAAGYVGSPVLNSSWGSDIMCLIFRKPVAA